ncbi:hypothetical protein HGRIS_012489 [Hohenbuehelia grisea]|uniref:Uncharacterized protein n=1 Tax=Hohenbuehelia grisea TaxID=104357 RepID=A0ABR3ISI7_9AGAR
MERITSASVSRYGAANPDLNHVDFIVHNFTDESPFTFLPTQRRDPLLDVGSKLLKATVPQLGLSVWRDVASENEEIVGEGRIVAYTYRRQPPEISSSTRRSDAFEDIKDWGVKACTEEVFRLSDLEEFQSTEFPVRAHPVVLKSPPRASRQDVAGNESPPERSKLEDAPLYGLIDPPYILPSLFQEDETIPSVKEFKGEPIPIPPHSFTEFLPNPYARSAWLVPLRGAFAWRGSTAAVLLQASESDTPTPAGTSTAGTHEQIIWTQASAKAFWSFLLSLRKGGNLGPLGVSFHVVKSALASQSTRSANWPKSADRAAGGREPPQNGLAASSPRLSSPNHPTLLVDHFKIYHESAYAMHVRSVLDAWRYIVPVDEPVKNPRTIKVRVLKGAKLVLVDEKSSGILLS